MFHGVPGVPRGKMERFSGKATKLTSLNFDSCCSAGFNPAQ